MKPHQRGTPYAQDQDVIQVAPDRRTHGRDTTPCINPYHIIPYAMMQCPAMATRTLIIDTLAHDDVERAMREAPDFIQARLARFQQNRPETIKPLQHVTRHAEPHYFYWLEGKTDELGLAIVIPNLLAGSGTNKKNIGGDIIPALSNPVRSSDAQLIAESAFIVAHEMGHVAQIAQKHLAPAVQAINKEGEGSFDIEQWQKQFAAELYADTFALKTCQMALPNQQFLSGAQALLDTRSLVTMAQIMTTPGHATPQLVYATSPIIHQALHDIGRDGFQDKTVMQRLEQGAPAASEIKEVCDLYQGMFFAGQCNDANTMIHALGERAAKAQTRLGALLPRDCLSAYGRILPEGSYAPQIMEAALDKINQSSAGQKFLPDYPDADAAMVAACLRSRLQHHSQPHLAPPPAAPPLAAPQRKM